MKQCLLLLLLLASGQSLSQDLCLLEEIGLTDQSPLPEKLYYQGTCQYRNENFSASVRLWRALSAMDDIDPAHQELQANSLNNLGYLLYFGYGTQENKQAAIEHWHKAVSMGQTESVYHLCHTYADGTKSTYNKVKALPHCKQAKRIYQAIDVKDEGDETILRLIGKYLLDLND